MLSFLNPYMTYLRIGSGVLLLMFAAWAFRVNSLRGEYHDHLDHIASNFKAAGMKEVHFDDLADDVNRLASDRDAVASYLAAANNKIGIQNDKIAQLGQATAEAGAKSEAAQKQADLAVADRNAWIVQAQLGAKRTVAGTDAQEKQECDDSLTSLYRSGF